MTDKNDLGPSSTSSSSSLARKANNNDQDYAAEPKAFNGDLEALQSNENRNSINEEEGSDFDEMSRIESHVESSRRLSRRLTGAEDLIQKANSTNEPLPSMGGGRDYPPPLPDRDPYIVGYDGPDDPTHPHNWHLGKKIFLSAIVGLSAFLVSLGSAMFAEGSSQVEELFHVGPTVATLGTSLFVFGFASGPIVWGPVSELYGRRMVQLISSFGYICFSFAVAAAKDLQTVMLCRFFAGFVGASPLVVSPAIMADLFATRYRGLAMTVFASVLFGGPMMAPILGGFIVKNASMGWRWTSYMCGIVGALAAILMLFFLDETHHGLILCRKAETLRRRTGNWGIAAPHEEFSLSFKEIMEKNIARPVVMLVTEPILFLITLYNAFIYGIIYLCLTAVPAIFGQRYHFRPGVAELPYISMLIGVLIGGTMTVLFERRFIAALEKTGKPVPEERLPPMMIGAFFFVIGLFWTGWTGDYPTHVHWIVPTIGAAFIGCGLMCIFLPCINYIIDCYLFYAASAMAGNTLLRSAFGAAFPLFARPMILNLTIKWAMTLLGCIALVLLPVPFLFYKYGAALRKKSKYSMEL